MTALAMILTAAMVVPASGPERESGVIAEPQPLDLSGEWEGVLRNFYGLHLDVRVSGGRLEMPTALGGVFPTSSLTDEGDGKCRWRLGNFVYLGIYQQERGRLIVCFSQKRRPRDFQLTEDRGILILHRVKSRK